MKVKKLQKVFSFYILLNTIFLISCKKDVKKCNLSLFKIFIPNSWSCKENPKGFSGYLITKTKDTITFNFGYDISSLTEKEPNVVYFPVSKKRLYENQYDTSKFVIAKRQFFDIDNYRKQNVFFDKINGYSAKITVPRRSGNGTTGIYFDSLSFNESLGYFKFHLFGKNLETSEECLLRKSFKTIEFNLEKANL